MDMLNLFYGLIDMVFGALTTLAVIWTLQPAKFWDLMKLKQKTKR